VASTYIAGPHPSPQAAEQPVAEALDRRRQLAEGSHPPLMGALIRLVATYAICAIFYLGHTGPVEAKIYTMRGFENIGIRDAAPQYYDRCFINDNAVINFLSNDGRVRHDNIICFLFVGPALPTQPKINLKFFIGRTFDGNGRISLWFISNGEYLRNIIGGGFSFVSSTNCIARRFPWEEIGYGWNQINISAQLALLSIGRNYGLVCGGIGRFARVMRSPASFLNAADTRDENTDSYERVSDDSDGRNPRPPMYLAIVLGTLSIGGFALACMGLNGAGNALYLFGGWFVAAVCGGALVSVNGHGIIQALSSHTSLRPGRLALR